MFYSYYMVITIYLYNTMYILLNNSKINLNLLYKFQESFFFKYCDRKLYNYNILICV